MSQSIIGGFRASCIRSQYRIAFWKKKKKKKTFCEEPLQDETLQTDLPTHV